MHYTSTMVERKKNRLDIVDESCTMPALSKVLFPLPLVEMAALELENIN